MNTRTMNARLWTWAGPGILLATLAGCASSSEPPSVGGNSNWLQRCESNADCGGDYDCLCGVCTLACENADECGELNAAASCEVPETTGGECGATTTACVLRCAQNEACSAELGDGYTCLDSSCVLPETAGDTLGQGDAPVRNPDGIRSPCVGPAVNEQVAWDGESALGSPAAVFAPLEGTCQAELRWDGTGFDTHPVTPGRGTTTVTVEVMIDQGSAAFITLEANGGEPEYCNSLEATAMVGVRSDDGTFDAMGMTTIRAFEAGKPPRELSFDVEMNAHVGSLAVDLQEDESATMHFRLDGAGNNCAGEVELSIESPPANGVGMAGGGPLASWSSSGCPLGEKPFDRDQTLGEGGTTLAELITDRFGELMFDGSWNDGGDTVLRIRTTVPDAGPLCSELSPSRVVTVPVAVEYGTEDDRLPPHATTQARVRAGLMDSGEIQELSFWLDERATCGSTSDTLPHYPEADCAEVSEVTVQLGINTDGAALGISDRGLNVYFEPRDPGAERNVVRLEDLTSR